ncbi:MAG: histidine phosphatase family protein [Bdellovibrionales bacterium]|nr:histidine phosphatase family protein [Bdellovibrionales bacterium]
MASILYPKHPVRLIFFRHGQTDWNASGRIQGHLDVPLNDVGRAQAGRLLEPLRRWGVDSFLSSDLSRASETAEIAAAETGIPVAKDPGLREIFLGKLQGLTRDEIAAAYGDEFSTRLRHEPLTDEDIVALGSESTEQVMARVFGALQRFLAANPGALTVGVCTHGGVIRRVIQSTLPKNVFPPPTPNTVLYPFEWTGDLHDADSSSAEQGRPSFVRLIHQSPWQF